LIAASTRVWFSACSTSTSVAGLRLFFFCHHNVSP
jgi:hypothetical protein